MRRCLRLGYATHTGLGTVLQRYDDLFATCSRLLTLRRGTLAFNNGMNDGVITALAKANWNFTTMHRIFSCITIDERKATVDGMGCLEYV